MAKTIRDPSEAHLEELIHEPQFNPILEKSAREFFLLCNFLAGNNPTGWTKKHFFQTITEANEFETFLDDYGARYNKTYSFLTELVASLRGFGLAGYSLKHLENRYEKYGLEEDQEEKQSFQRELSEALSFVGSSIQSLAKEICEEASRVGVSIPAGEFGEKKFTEASAKKHLPRNVDEEELTHEEQKIAEVTSKYLRAVEMFESMKVRKIADPEKRKSYIERHCTEERARVCEAQIHNLQSKYDTYIKNTTTEREDSRLVRLRGHVSATLHLAQAVTHFVHFYERHENDIRSERAKERIAALIDKNAVLDRVLNFSLFHADRIFRRGKALAEALLPQYTNTKTVDVSLLDGNYLHARPASLVVAIVNHYGVPVEMEIEGSKCNAASIMQVMILAGTHSGAKKLRFHGDERPLYDIQALFESGLGEQGLESLPEKLSYLRGG